MEKNFHTNWEKVGIYFAAIIAFITVVAYIADMKERIAKLETRQETIINNWNNTDLK